MTNVNYRYAFLFSLVLIISCSKKIIESQSGAALDDEKEEIIFLTGYITSHVDHFVLSNLEVNKVDGTLKKIEKSHTIKTGDLEIIQYDRNKKILAKNYIPNPLILDLEYVNDADQFARKTEELREADFTIRFQKQPGACSLSISRIDLSKSSKSNTLSHDLCSK
jgi:hypothetical protein